MDATLFNPPVGVNPCMSYKGMCRPKVYVWF